MPLAIGTPLNKSHTFDMYTCVRSFVYSYSATSFYSYAHTYTCKYSEFIITIYIFVYLLYITLVPLILPLPFNEVIHTDRKHSKHLLVFSICESKTFSNYICVANIYIYFGS